MLAQTATGVGEALERLGGTAVFEAKLDGARVQIHRAGDAVSIYTRSLDDVTARLPEVVDATLALPVTDLIADAEAIALRPDGRPHRFQVTASRFGRSVDIAAARDRAAAVGVLLRPAAPRRRRSARPARPASASRRSTRSCRRPSGSTGSITDDADAAQRFLDATLAAGHEGRDGEVADGAVRGGPPRRGLAEGQAGAHPRPGGARRRVGLGPAHRQAVQHPPRRPRPGDRWLRHARQDFQGHDGRDAGLADRAVHRTGRRPDGRLRGQACGPSRWSRSRSTACRVDRATPAAWRCASRGCCATATTRAPPRPTPSTPSARIYERELNDPVSPTAASRR